MRKEEIMYTINKKKKRSKKAKQQLDFLQVIYILLTRISLHQYFL